MPAMRTAALLPTLVSTAALAAVLAAAHPANAGLDAFRGRASVPQLDVIDVIVRSDEILAVDGRAGGGVVRERLLGGEEVLWADARGRVGVVVTNKRILAATADAARWMWTYIGVHESLPHSIALGDRVALVLTEDRVIGVAAGARERFFAEELGPHEVLRDYVIGENVAVIVTERRVLGLSAFQAGFYEEQIAIHEELRGVSTRADFATVTTHRRLLVFKAATGAWEERRLSLR